MSYLCTKFEEKPVFVLQTEIIISSKAGSFYKTVGFLLPFLFICLLILCILLKFKLLAGKGYIYSQKTTAQNSTILVCLCTVHVIAVVKFIFAFWKLENLISLSSIDNLPRVWKSYKFCLAHLLFLQLSLATTTGFLLYPGKWEWSSRNTSTDFLLLSPCSNMWSTDHLCCHLGTW